MDKVLKIINNINNLIKNKKVNVFNIVIMNYHTMNLIMTLQYVCMIKIIAMICNFHLY